MREWLSHDVLIEVIDGFHGPYVKIYIVQPPRCLEADIPPEQLIKILPRVLESIKNSLPSHPRYKNTPGELKSLTQSLDLALVGLKEAAKALEGVRK